MRLKKQKRGKVAMTTKEKMKWMTAGFLAAHIFLFCVIFRAPKKRWEQDSYDCAIVCGCRVKAASRPTR